MNCGVSQLGKINMQSKVFIFCIYLVRSKVDIDISVILLSRIKNKKIRQAYTLIKLIAVKK